MTNRRGFGARAAQARGELATSRPALSDWDLIATTTGAEWATDAVRALTSSNRAILGGWPGTVPEARARLDAVWSMLAVRPDTRTRERLTRCAYDAAKSTWRRSAGAEPRE